MPNNRNVSESSSDESSGGESDELLEPSEPLPMEGLQETISGGAWIAWWAGILGVVLLVVGGVMSASGDHDEMPYVMFGLLLYAAYWCEAVCGKACTYLSNVQSEKHFMRYVSDLQEARPVITFHIQNYHYVTKTKKVGKETRTVTERKNTHSASATYPILGFTDETLSPAQTVAMFHLLHRSGASHEDKLLHETVIRVDETGEKRLILTCEFPQTFLPRDEATAQHITQFAEDFYRANTKDRYQDKSQRHELSCWHTSHALVVLSSDGSTVTRKPWWMSRLWHLLSTLLFLGLPFRYLIYRKTQKVVWQVRKHYSAFYPSSWTTDPIHSLKHSSHPLVAEVAKLGPDVGIEASAEGGFLDLPQGEASDVILDVEVLEGDLRLDAPEYWKNQDMNEGFDVVEHLDESDGLRQIIQGLLDDCFVCKATRDRPGRMPSRLVVEVVQRVEDCELWKRYARKRGQISSRRGEVTQLCDMEGSGEAKTSRCLGELGRRLDSSINEFYLFHGSSPAGVLGIGSSGFNLQLAGSRSGLMFGPGAYFAEASSKCDEYASEEPTDLFQGKCALLLCRVACGELFRVDKSDKPAIQRAMTSGDFDGVLGDREAAVGTYREFVAFDEAQVYPEYVVIYRREFG